MQDPTEVLQGQAAPPGQIQNWSGSRFGQVNSTIVIETTQMHA